MPDAHYPINFVVKHPNRLVFLRGRPALGRWETCQISLERLVACFQIGVSLNRIAKQGGDQETVNEFWWS
jgi:hypothetical protein